MFWTLSQVAIGGALGSVLRYVTVASFGAAFGAPWAVAAVNVLGSFVIGVLFVALTSRAHMQPLLMAGVLGGFTTFSAFSLDALKLWQSGQMVQAILYVGLSVGLSLIAVALGAALAKGALG